MKTLRQAKILELIRNNSIETQSDLLEMLRKDGFNVTQATVSRDIKEHINMHMILYQAVKKCRIHICLQQQ